MTKLARKLRLHDYFALAFGTMVGTGWIVLMDDWLGRGGPLGAMFGFAIGGGFLLPGGFGYGPRGAPPAERRRRSRVHRAGFCPACQLLHRLDDVVGIFYRLSMGGRGRRQAG